MTELARVTTLEEIVALATERRKRLGLSQLDMDARAGWADGYCAKLEAGMKGLGKVSLPLLLGALQVELTLMPTAGKHSVSYGGTTLYAHTAQKHHALIGAKGGRARAATTSRKKLRAIARAGARARWHKGRQA